MKQISNRKQGEAKNGTPEVEVVTVAVLLSPMHPRKQVKCFGDMSDYHQTSCAEQLQERAENLFSKEHQPRTNKKNACCTSATSALANVAFITPLG